MLLLQCPRCKQRMKYEGRTILLGSKRKECVYCGQTFIIKEHIVQDIDGKNRV